MCHLLKKKFQELALLWTFLPERVNHGYPYLKQLVLSRINLGKLLSSSGWLRLLVPFIPHFQILERFLVILATDTHQTKRLSCIAI